MISQTYVGLLISLLGFAANHLKIDIAHEELVQLAGALVSVYGIIHAAWGRHRHGDISVLGLKK